MSELKAVLDALEMTRSSRNPLPGLLHHSDRGVQYSAGAHRLALGKFGAISSMSRKGNCWDNAVAESAFGTLKCKLDLEHAIGTRAETRAIVFERSKPEAILPAGAWLGSRRRCCGGKKWIEVWYNRERRHSSLGFLAPAVFEAKHLTLFSTSTKTCFFKPWVFDQDVLNTVIDAFSGALVNAPVDGETQVGWVISEVLEAEQHAVFWCEFVRLA
jgi:hypothetical protein